MGLPVLWSMSQQVPGMLEITVCPLPLFVLLLYQRYVATHHTVIHIFIFCFLLQTTVFLLLQLQRVLALLVEHTYRALLRWVGQ